LKAPFIGVWVLSTNFGKPSVEGIPLPEKIVTAAVASKILIRTGPDTVPSVDFDVPPMGTNAPITGQVLGLSNPTDYRALMLISAITNVWWDKTHNVHGIPIAEDGSFKVKGWVVDPHDLTVPDIGTSEYGLFPPTSPNTAPRGPPCLKKSRKRPSPLKLKAEVARFRSLLM